MKYIEYQDIINYCFGFANSNRESGEILFKCNGYLNEEGVDISVKVIIRRLLMQLDEAHKLFIKEAEGKSEEYVSSELQKDMGVDCKVLNIDDVKGFKGACDYSYLIEKLVK